MIGVLVEPAVTAAVTRDEAKLLDPALNADGLGYAVEPLGPKVPEQAVHGLRGRARWPPYHVRADLHFAVQRVGLLSTPDAVQVVPHPRSLSLSKGFHVVPTHAP